ncbi:MAG: hypothetical protein ABEH77_10170 [Halobacteriaceae archaeon]
MDRTATATRAEEEAEADRRDGLRGRLRARLAGAVSARTFLLALVLSVGGAVAGGAVPLLGTVGGVLGVAGAGALLGLAGRSAYPEVALAGFLAAGVAAFLDFLVVSLVAGPTVAAVGAGAGALGGVVGHYFGRDLRAGLTRDL